MGLFEHAPTDGMNSYYSREMRKEKSHETTTLPSVPPLQQPWSATGGARPKERKYTQTQEQNMPNQPLHNFSSRQQQQVDAPTSQINKTGFSDNIGNIIQRQTDITAQLIQKQHMVTLLQRTIPVFDGDPLQYGSFIRAFEQGIERKTNINQDRLYYLEQYTRGEPRELVRSCFHMPENSGFVRAKHLLKEHFGNEIENSNSIYGQDIELACNQVRGC